MDGTEHQEVIDAWIAGAQRQLAPMTPLHPDWPDVSSDDRGPDVAPLVEFDGTLQTIHSWGWSAEGAFKDLRHLLEVD